MTLELSRNQKMVYQLIEKSDKPMKAYRIFFRSKQKVLNLPLKFIELWIS
jgi:hypothetical protein